MPWKQPLYATVCGMMLILQSACGRVSPASFCAVYIPVYTAADDTEETRKQADANNAVWLLQCAADD